MSTESVTRELRFDRGVIEPVAGSDGFLRARVVIARTGVFPYMTSQGCVRLEAKLPEDLLSEETVFSAKGVPVTDGHPPMSDNSGLLNKDNWGKYVKGALGDEIIVRDGCITAHETIYDQSLIEDLKAGRKVEVSIGFTTDLVYDDGEFAGQRYDARQTNIRINHVAHVADGRGGETVRAYFDAAGAWAVQQDEGQNNLLGDDNMSEENKNTAPTAAAGGDANAVFEGLKKFFAMLRGTVAADDADGKKDNADLSGRQAEELAVKNKELEAKVDELEAKLKTKASIDAESAAEAKIEQAVNARLALLDAARAAAPDIDVAGKSDKEIKAAVIDKLLPFENGVKADRAEDVAVDARFDAALALAKERAVIAGGQAGAAATSRLDANEIAKKRAARLNIMEPDHSAGRKEV